MTMSIWADGFTDVEVQEMHGTVSENVGEGLESCSVTLMVDWALRHDVVATIVGGLYVWPYSAGYLKPPYATSAAIKPMDNKPVSFVDGAIVYEKALITITYNHRDGEDPETLYSESLEPTAEFLTLDYRRFAWSEDGEPGDGLLEGEAPGKLMRGMNLVRTQYKLESIPSAVLTAFGGVNSAPYTSATLGLTFDAETLLYCPPTLDRTFTTDGTEGWNMQTKFQVKPTGWNKFWRAKTQSWEKIYDLEAEEEYNNYPLESFAALLY